MRKIPLPSQTGTEELVCCLIDNVKLHPFSFTGFDRRARPEDIKISHGNTGRYGINDQTVWLKKDLIIEWSGFCKLYQ